MQAHVNTDFIAILAPSVQKRMSNLDPKSAIDIKLLGDAAIIMENVCRPM